jgi:hypothetical protein
MLTGEEFKEIQTALTQIVALNGRPFFQTVFAGPDFLVALNKNVGLAASDEQVAAGAIHACLRREWMDEPCWLIRLLSQVKANGGVAGVNQVANIDAVIQRLNQKVNVLDEIWYTHWVEGGLLPFVDRTPLRDTLKDFSRSVGRAILRIEGEPNTGKSYSKQLLEHVSASEGWSFRIISIEVEKGSEIGMNAMVLAQLIIGEMGFPNSVSDSGLQDLTVHNIPMLQTWILRCARESDKRWWFFLDGFGTLPESNTARSLIQGLADKIANGSYRENLRMILVDYDKPLSRVEEEKVAFDRSDTPLTAQVAEQAVYDCLDRLYRQLGRVPAKDELETKAKALLTDIPAVEPWIVALNKRLRAAAKAIRNGQ